MSKNNDNKLAVLNSKPRIWSDLGLFGNSLQEKTSLILPLLFGIDYKAPFVSCIFNNRARMSSRDRHFRQTVPIRSCSFVAGIRRSFDDNVKITEKSDSENENEDVNLTPSKLALEKMEYKFQQCRKKRQQLKKMNRSKNEILPLEKSIQNISESSSSNRLDHDKKQTDEPLALSISAKISSALSPLSKLSISNVKGKPPLKGFDKSRSMRKRLLGVYQSDEEEFNIHEEAEDSGYEISETKSAITNEDSMSDRYHHLTPSIIHSDGRTTSRASLASSLRPGSSELDESAWGSQDLFETSTDDNRSFRKSRDFYSIEEGPSEKERDAEEVDLRPAQITGSSLTGESELIKDIDDNKDNYNLSGYLTTQIKKEDKSSSPSASPESPAFLRRKFRTERRSTSDPVDSSLIFTTFGDHYPSSYGSRAEYIGPAVAALRAKYEKDQFRTPSLDAVEKFESKSGSKTETKEIPRIATKKMSFYSEQRNVSKSCQTSTNQSDIGINTEIDFNLMELILNKILTKKYSVYTQTEKPRKEKWTKDIAIGTEKFSRERFSALPDTKSKSNQTDSSWIRVKNIGISTEDLNESQYTLKRGYKAIRDSYLSKNIQIDNTKKDVSIDIQVFTDSEMETDSQESQMIPLKSSEESELVSEIEENQVAVEMPSTYSGNHYPMSNNYRYRSPTRRIEHLELSDEGDDRESERVRSRPIITEIQSRKYYEDKVKKLYQSPEHRYREDLIGHDRRYRHSLIKEKRYRENSISPERKFQEFHSSDKKYEANIQEKDLKQIDDHYVENELVDDANKNLDKIVKKIEECNDLVEYDRTNNNKLVEKSHLKDSFLQSLSKNLRTHSTVVISINQPRKREISEITTVTTMDKDGKLSRKTQVTTTKKVPVLIRTEDEGLEPIITSPPPTTPGSNSPGSKSFVQSESSTRPTSALDYQRQMRSMTPAFSENEINKTINDPFQIFVSEPPNESSVIRDQELMKESECNILNPMRGKRSTVHWEETSSSTLCNELSSDAFKDDSGITHKPKAVTLTSETMIESDGNDTKVETRSRAARKYSSETIKVPDIASQTFLSDSHTVPVTSGLSGPQSIKCLDGKNLDRSSKFLEKEIEKSTKDTMKSYKNFSSSLSKSTPSLSSPDVNRKRTLSGYRSQQQSKESLATISSRTPEQSYTNLNQETLSSCKTQSNKLVPLEAIKSSPSAKAEGHQIDNTSGDLKSKGTEILTRIIKTKHLEDRKNSKTVVEQELQSGDGVNDYDGCKISSSITMQSPDYEKNKAMIREVNDDDISIRATPSLESLRKHEKYENTTGTGEMMTTTKFERFKLDPSQSGREETGWEYSMECNCVNSVNTCVRTIVKHKRAHLPYSMTQYESSV